MLSAFHVVQNLIGSGWLLASCCMPHFRLYTLPLFMADTCQPAIRLLIFFEEISRLLPFLNKCRNS